MNTAKQVTAMIGLLFLAFVVFGLYMLNEARRQAAAEETQTEEIAHRGAELFVTNCRNCHGLLGLGPEEGAIAPALNNPAFLIFDDPAVIELGGERVEVTETPQGEADEIRTFLHETIECGRVGTIMPTWGEEHAGPLSDTQIDQIVTLITTGRWDLVQEIGEEHDLATDPPTTREDILFDANDIGNLAVTRASCGQYRGAEAAEFRNRNPFAVTAGAGGPVGTPAAEDPSADLGEVEGVTPAVFFQNNCAVCHGEQREGLVGPALTPERLGGLDEELLFNTIQEGREGTPMPAWGEDFGGPLSEEEIRIMVEFITTIEP